MQHSKSKIQTHFLPGVFLVVRRRIWARSLIQHPLRNLWRETVICIKMSRDLQETNQRAPPEHCGNKKSHIIITPAVWGLK